MNYLDAGQPFHVAGGFLVSHDRLSAVESVVQSFLNDGQGEIKGTHLMRSAAGQRRAIALLEQLGAAGAVPFFIIMDRAFSIAGKVVDVFLDPMHQPNVDWLPTSDVPQRGQEAARTVNGTVEGVTDALRLGSVLFDWTTPSDQLPPDRGGLLRAGAQWPAALDVKRVVAALRMEQGPRVLL